MSMIRCPECGKEISDKAVSCPFCGCPSEYFTDTGAAANDAADNKGDGIKYFIASQEQIDAYAQKLEASGKVTRDFLDNRIAISGCAAKRLELWQSIYAVYETTVKDMLDEVKNKVNNLEDWADYVYDIKAMVSEFTNVAHDALGKYKLKIDYGFFVDSVDASLYEINEELDQAIVKKIFMEAKINPYKLGLEMEEFNPERPVTFVGGGFGIGGAISGVLSATALNLSMDLINQARKVGHARKEMSRISAQVEELKEKIPEAENKVFKNGYHIDEMVWYYTQVAEVVFNQALHFLSDSLLMPEPYDSERIPVYNDSEDEYDDDYDDYDDDDYDDYDDDDDDDDYDDDDDDCEYEEIEWADRNWYYEDGYRIIPKEYITFRTLRWLEQDPFKESIYDQLIALYPDRWKEIFNFLKQYNLQYYYCQKSKYFGRNSTKETIRNADSIEFPGDSNTKEQIINDLSAYINSIRDLTTDSSTVEIEPDKDNQQVQKVSVADSINDRELKILEENAKKLWSFGLSDSDIRQIKNEVSDLLNTGKYIEEIQNFITVCDNTLARRKG